MKTIFFKADSNGGSPIPVVKGGAVSTLVEHLVNSNNKQQLFEMTIVSIYDKEAQLKSKDYANVNFVWIKIPAVIRVFDKILFFIVLHFFKKRKVISYRTFFSLIYYIIKSASFLHKSLYDCVILENNIPLIWIIRLSKYKGNIWYHLHNIPRTAARSKPTFKKCKYLCVSRFVADQLQSCPLGPIDKQNIKVLYNCIDTNLFSKKNIDIDMREKLGISKDEFVLIFVGRMSQEKGIDKLLEAIPLMQEQKIKVLIVGSLISDTKAIDSYQKELIKLSNALKDKIIYTGFVKQSELPDFYNIADVAVLPSIWEEPAGLTMVEAMSCGTPVITTKSGGIPEYVADCGILLENDESLSVNIAKSVDRLLSDEKLRHEMSLKSISRVKENFSSVVYLDNFIKSINDNF
ncbi:MAG: glycosyltransferase family 4 protein [Bacteroidales bacterium]|nr:glycosyltransferase family 4 protein [Bacteroidales bacterium]